MAKDRKSSSRVAAAPAGKRAQRRLQRLERRLSEVRELEAQRSQRVEEARREGAPRKVEKRREKKLERVHERMLALEAEIARLRPVTEPAPEPQPVPDPATDQVAGLGGPVMGYCLRDRERVEIQGPVPATMKNGRPALAGTCPRCGGRLVRPARREG